MTEHTPTPWREQSNGWVPWRGAIGILPANLDEEHAIAWTTSGDNEEANAAFIVKAVNNHDLLVQAIKDIKQATLEGRVCDDVAWFSQIETLHDFCENILSRVGEARE